MYTPSFLPRINRIIMEFKLKHDLDMEYQKKGINRIIMEFKFVDGDLRTFRAEAELIES